MQYRFYHCDLDEAMTFCRHHAIEVVDVTCIRSEVYDFEFGDDTDEELIEDHFPGVLA